MRSGWWTAVVVGCAIGCGHPQAPDRGPSRDPIAVAPPDAAVAAVEPPVDAPVLVAITPVDAPAPVVAVDAPVVDVDAPDVETPPLPPARWQKPCAALLRTAQSTLAASYPAFKRGKIETLRKPRGVRFTAKVHDPIHQRFMNKEATFTAEVIEHSSPEAGYLIPSVTGPEGDEQDSVSMSRWSTTRQGSLEAQIIRHALAVEFTKAFDPALRACLR